MYDLFNHCHGEDFNTNSQTRGSNIIYFLFFSYNISKKVQQIKMTGFNEVTTSDCCRIFIDISNEIMIKHNMKVTSSPLEGNLQSTRLQAVKRYRKYLNSHINRQIYKTHLLEFMQHKDNVN